MGRGGMYALDGNRIPRCIYTSANYPSASSLHPICPHLPRKRSVSARCRSHRHSRSLTHVLVDGNVGYRIRHIHVETQSGFECSRNKFRGALCPISAETKSTSQNHLLWGWSVFTICI